MIVAISVGNAHVAIGLMDRDKAVFLEHADTDTKKTDLEYSFDLIRAFEKHGIDPRTVEGGVVASVVPQLSLLVVNAVQRVFSFTPYLVSAKKPHTLPLAIDNPSALGANLLADAVAVRHFYGYPSVLVDMGTATSVGVLDGKGVYRGGAILPGLGSSVRALLKDASALPTLRLHGATTVLAKETTVCIDSGAIYGNAAMIDGMIEKIGTELRNEANAAGEPFPEGTEPVVVMTGRLAFLVSPEMKKKVTVDETLTLKGLVLLYEERKEARK